MNRNIKDAMGVIFDNLTSEDFPSPEGHYIEGDKSDFKFLKSGQVLEVDVQTYSPFQLLLVKHLGIDYLIVLSVFEFDEDFPSTVNITETDLTPGMVALFLHEVRPKRLSRFSEDYLNEKIFYPIQENNDYSGHDAFLIAGLFGSFRAYSIDALTDLSIANCIVNFTMEQPNFNRTVLKEHHLKIVKECPLYSIKGLINQFARIFWTTDFETAYIKLYQLLEYLFPIPYVQKAHFKIGNKQNNVLDLLDIFYNILEWKYIEINSLQKLLKEVPKNEMPELSLCNSISNTQDIYIKNSKIIYKTRCSIVHKRINQKELQIDEDMWDELFTTILIIIKKLYIKYENILENN